MKLEWLKVVYPKIVFTCDIQYCYAVPAVFCDGRPRIEVTGWEQLQLLFSLKRHRRRGVPGWQQLCHTLVHSGVGGCSDASTHMYCMARSRPLPLTRVNLPYIPSCVYAVASDTIDAGRVSVPPLTRRLPHSTVVPLGTALYHGGGLFPSGLKSPPVFLLPSVLAPTGWCRRRLTLAEIWGVSDVPHRIVELLPSMPSVASAWHASRLLLPGKSLEHGVRLMLARLEGRVEGGRIIFSRETKERQRREIEGPTSGEIEEGGSAESLGHVSKSFSHVRKVAASINEFGKDTRAVSEMNIAPYPRRLTKPSLNTIPEEHEDYGGKLEALTDLIPEVYKDCGGKFEALTISIPGEHVGYGKEPGADCKSVGRLEGPLPESHDLNVNNSSDIYKDHSRTGAVSDRLGLKATKSDDARVQVEQWDEELGTVMGVENGKKLALAAEAIRTFCLRWWRRRLTRSFFCWLHQQKEYQSVGLDDMAHVVECVQINTPGNPSKEYRWSILGRAVYCDWWSERDARHFKDLRAARDVINRSSKASWF